MADERLPIKFFAKREVDNMRVEAGGGGDPPKFVLSPEELMIKSRAFVDVVQEFKAEVLKKEKENSLIPVVFKTKIIDDATAKTHRREVSNLFRTGTDNNVLGLAEEDELIIKVDDSREVEKIIERLNNTQRYAHALSAIDSISDFKPIIDKSESSEPIDYKVKLIDFQNYEQNTAIRNYFERSIKELGLEISRTNYTPSHVVYNIKGVNLDEFMSINQNEVFEAIFSIEPMPKYTVALDMGEDEATINISSPKQGKKYAIVGVLDNGVADIPHLKPWLTEERYTAYPEPYVKRDHGTFVSGVVVYGDHLEDQEWVGTEGVKILDACVYPDTDKEGIEEDELIRNIQEAVKAHHRKVKVWNLSISVVNEVDEYSFSDFAVALDALQDQYGVLICKSAGNCGNFRKGHPKGKIHQGADSVRSIVVGSLAHKKASLDFAEVDNPSPFTRIGRGPSYIIKPEIVHYGGNAGTDGNGSMVTTGVKSFGLDGAVRQSVGTSYSTPRIAALAAGLHQEMDEEFDPLLIKALMVHSASYSENLNVPVTERVNQVGFGKPQPVREILYNSPHEVTLILRDEIAKGEYIDMMDFPMPDCLVDGDYFTGQIVVTLVYNPILDSSQRAEYCQSNVDIKMGTYDGKKDRDTTKRNILNPVGRDGSQNVLLEDYYSKKKMRSNTDEFALKERLLIKYGDKYYPVKKYAVNLSEMTDGNQKKFLTKDKNWYLYIRGLYRDHIEVKSQQEGSVPSQEFCLMVTIKDPTGTKPVYNEANQKLNEYNFWHNSIKLQTDVTIRN
ncbi:S8 family peptidase [Alkalicella caledoniensis]|uniref:S8 family peptidase n=1 Tax=Alkalicella caledoniensis TaxID=2731377 RepID=A0A7G9W3Q5_ALKCA|nr:S8 family peptidase [Alkalicella caledoniensis]QNO13317.1 S8 family peptidase [Alkalicella caledoniensis]